MKEEGKGGCVAITEVVDANADVNDKIDVLDAIVIDGVTVTICGVAVTVTNVVCTVVSGVTGVSDVVVGGGGSGAFPFADSVMVMNDVCVLNPKENTEDGTFSVVVLSTRDEGSELGSGGEDGGRGGGGGLF